MQESELNLLVLGQVQHVKTVTNSYTTKNFLLKYFNIITQSATSSMEIKGAVVGNKLVLDIPTAGQTRKEHIPLKEPPYLALTNRHLEPIFLRLTGGDEAI
jgi:hypothetical protein